MIDVLLNQPAGIAAKQNRDAAVLRRRDTPALSIGKP